MSDTALHELAALYGITCAMDSESLQQFNDEDQYLVDILQAAGLPITSASEAEALLQRFREARRQQILGPVRIVSENDTPFSVPIRLSETDECRYRWELTEESGRLHSGTFAVHDLIASAQPISEDYVECPYVLEISSVMPTGYHRLTIYLTDSPEDQIVASMMLIITPDSCYVPPGIAGESRVWGLSAYLHALRSRSSWGIGDFSDLKRVLSWGAGQGAGLVHTQPLHALDVGLAGTFNPYSPSSRSHLNSLFVDIEVIPECAESENVQELINDARYQARLVYLRNQDQIDYEGVYRIKAEALRVLWTHFTANHLNPTTDRGEAFRRFQREGGTTLRFFALYLAILEKFSGDEYSRRGWPSWPEPFRNPDSEDVAEFARSHESEIEYYQYVQWQAATQLAAIGRRSMELGLKVGLIAEFPYGYASDGFESWYYRDLLLSGALLDRQQQNPNVVDPAEGLTPVIASRLMERCYQPLIEGLRHTMLQAGAVIIRSVGNYFQASFSLAGQEVKRMAFMRFPAGDLLGIIALESRRKRCLVIADHLDLLAKEQQDELRRRNILSYNVLLQTNGGWQTEPITTDYMPMSVVSSSAPFLAAMKGLWKGLDISVKTAARIFRCTADKETAILARAADRARFLINMDHEGLLPDGCGLDQAAFPEIDQSLIAATQVLLARSPAKILLVTVNDLLGDALQATPPVMDDQAFWRSRYATDLEHIIAGKEIETVFLALCRERGLGVVRPSASAPDRRKRQGLRVPSCFYRLQLHKEFTFLQAAEIIPYLKMLGVSHCYVSPFLMARPGSPHGYDIINHCCLNPEIGSREDFERMIAVLDENKMALLLDIVPNHMGVGSDNQWWMDVLENGEASLYADYFDINWQPLQSDMAGRVLLPVLGDHYGKVLESGRLMLRFHENAGSFFINYYDQQFPVDPVTYPVILQHDLQRLAERMGVKHDGYLEYQNVISSFSNLPAGEGKATAQALVRQSEKETNKRILARLCGDVPEVRRFVEENVILFNGEVEKSDSFDLLHGLLEKQAYRLAYWRVAADEINYRRFFDINDLAGLRMEEREVFEQTHKLVNDLITTGRVDGLRVDHPDGLYDPHQYFCRLQAAAAEDYPENISADLGSRKKNNYPLYVVAEKVLADWEHLPDSWPVSGTTGYEFAHTLNGVFIDTSAERQMTSLYHHFVGHRLDFEDILYNSKKHIITSAMVGELNVLTSLLYRLARADRSSRDFTLNLLREGLTEIVACFPVYRTYIASQRIDRRDRHFIQWAVARARARTQLHDVSVLDFIQDTLLLRNIKKPADLDCFLDFVMKLQQYTGPSMAKGLEDTTFYLYNRLLSLNEVGGNPQCFGVSVAAFHQKNKARMYHWPNSMVSSSTHDSKRSEDVRARMNVLTEMVPQWRQRVLSWSKRNCHLKTELENLLAPSKNDEYALYQNVLGAWPISPPDESEHQAFVKRMVDATIKGCREAKRHTSWVSPNTAYEQAVIGFVEGILSTASNAFLLDFIQFHTKISWFGMFNSISQLFLKLVVPGIPDIYQGNEIWRFCLVDPDNRRAVDFQKRQAMLMAMSDQIREVGDNVSEFQLELLQNMADGRAKMYTAMRVMTLRNTWPDVFARGSYLPLAVTGSNSRHICVFARIRGGQVVIAIAPRLYLTLMHGKTDLPLGEEVWGDTHVVLPANMTGIAWENIYSPGTGDAGGADMEATALRVGHLLQFWPVALLKGTFQN